VDVEVSSDEDVMPGPKHDAPAKKKASAGDDARDKGVSSVNPNIPNPISSAIVLVPIIVPPAGEHGRKHPPLATWRNKPIHQANQVMTQVELPPYHGSYSPLDLVNI
jgi:hypothetical protein